MGQIRTKGTGERQWRRGRRKDIADKRYNLTSHDTQEADGERGGGGDQEGGEQQGEEQGERPRPTPQEIWVGQVKAYDEAGVERGGWRGRRHHGGSGILREEGGAHQGKDGPHLYIKDPKPN